LTIIAALASLVGGHGDPDPAAAVDLSSNNLGSVGDNRRSINFGVVCNLCVDSSNFCRPYIFALPETDALFMTVARS